MHMMASLSFSSLFNNRYAICRNYSVLSISCSYVWLYSAKWDIIRGVHKWESWVFVFCRLFVYLVCQLVGLGAFVFCFFLLYLVWWTRRMARSFIIILEQVTYRMETTDKVWQSGPAFLITIWSHHLALDLWLPNFPYIWQKLLTCLSYCYLRFPTPAAKCKQK